MDIRKVKKLIQLVEQSSINELEISSADGTIKIARNTTENNSAKIAKATSSTIEDEQDNFIYSPMAGKFHNAPARETKPYIRVGETVNPGDTICVIEAMTLVNKIEANIGGVVAEILVENGDSVEFDQPLVRLKQ